MSNEILILVLMLAIIVLGGFCCYLCTIKSGVSAICIRNTHFMNATVYINGVSDTILEPGCILCKIVPAKTRISVSRGLETKCFTTESNKTSNVEV